jgi:O-antigen/teichoic acid export membrane protein
MILARLLAPEAFGTMAIVLSSASVIQAFTDIGVRDALIQNPRGSEPEYADAAWWLSFGRSLGIYAVLFFASPWIAVFYRNPQLTSLLRVAITSIILEGMMSARAYVALKEMKFPRWAVIYHGGGICGVVITLILSFHLRDVWALVLGSVAEGAARCALSYIICPYFPSIKPDREALRELLKYSRRVFGLSFLNLIFTRTDIFVLAKMFSATQLGLYAMASYLAQTPASFIINLEAQILMPTFSHIQGQKDRINQILLRVTSLIVLLGMPALAFVYFCGTFLLAAVYGQRYAGVGPVLTIAAAVALINLVNGPITTVFGATGFPQLHRRSVGLMAVTMVLLIYPLTKWLGLAGAQTACLVAMAAGYLLQVERIHKLTRLNVSQYGKIFLLSAATSVSVIIICIGVRSFAALARPLPNIALGVVGCLLAYAVTCGVLFRRAGRPA